MSKQPYAKTHHSYQAQLEKLISRGMIVDDHAAAIHTLQHINYYRLGIYWHSFETDHHTHQFASDTHFTDVVSLYEFDRKLRLLVFDALERLEISMRAQWAYHMSEAYGPHAHLNDKAHLRSFGPKKRDLWRENLDSLNKELQRSDEPFIKRQLRKYSNETPSIWAVSEVMSFGLLSKWFRCLRVSGLRKHIARAYGIHPEVLESWMQHLTVVRNNCAHHSRLWNRQFDRAKPMHPQHHTVIAADGFVQGHPLFNTLTIILYLLDIIAPEHGWRQRFMALVDEYPAVPISDMGFPDNWRERTIWQRGI